LKGESAHDPHEAYHGVFMTPRDPYPDDSEVGGDPPQIVHNHYSQSKNGNGVNASGLNSVLLACLIGIVGFLGIQLWNMNDRLARVETNVQTIMQQSAARP
jgi:hypothetical protein